MTSKNLPVPENSSDWVKFRLIDVQLTKVHLYLKMLRGDVRSRLREQQLQHVQETVRQLEMPRFTRRHPKLADALLREMLTLTRDFETELLNLEAQQKAKPEKSKSPQQAKGDGEDVDEQEDMDNGSGEGSESSSADQDGDAEEGESDQEKVQHALFFCSFVKCDADYIVYVHPRPRITR